MPDIPGPPEWVPTRERPAGGRDFLGLRTAAERIGYALMDGVTTVTPHVRYLTLRTWILDCYWRQRRPDSRVEFREYARRMEAAIVFANLLAGRESLFLIGADKARELLAEAGDEVDLVELVRNPASDIYAGPSLAFELDTDLDELVFSHPDVVPQSVFFEPREPQES